MSSEQIRQGDNGSVNSLSKRLYRHELAHKFHLMIKDMLWVLLFFVGYFLIIPELKATGRINLDYYRYFTGDGIGFANWRYVVANRNGLHILDINIQDQVEYYLIAVLIIFAFGLIKLIFSYRRDMNRILKDVQPLLDMGRRAEELASMTFSEDKYQTIEDAISHVDPNKIDSLSFDDQELKGIEEAMNNMLRRMNEAYRQQSRFVNDASHELRTPIAVIEGYANMLDRWGKEDETVLLESIEAIKHESSHMKYLVEQLLFLARGDSGKTKLNLESVNLTDMVKEIYEESIMIDENHIYRFNALPNEDIIIEADAALLKQAVRILVDNAAKYTNDKEEISLSVGFDRDGHAYMQVQDTGIGMKDADVEHIFERFYRADESRNSYGGTGLGLSIAKWIVDKHGGHFEVLSREDLGSRIRIVL